MPSGDARRVSDPSTFGRDDQPEGREDMAKLVYLNERGRPSECHVGELIPEVVIGREPGCALLLPKETTLSRRHARVQWIDALGDVAALDRDEAERLGEDAVQGLRGWLEKRVAG